MSLLPNYDGHQNKSHLELKFVVHGCFPQFCCLSTRSLPQRARCNSLCYTSFRLKSRHSRRYDLMGPLKQHRERKPLSLCSIGPAMIEHIQKHAEHHDGVLLTPSDWSHQPRASGLEVKQTTEHCIRIDAQQLDRLKEKPDGFKCCHNTCMHQECQCCSDHIRLEILIEFRGSMLLLTHGPLRGDFLCPQCRCRQHPHCPHRARGRVQCTSS